MESKEQKAAECEFCWMKTGECPERCEKEETERGIQAQTTAAGTTRYVPTAPAVTYRAEGYAGLDSTAQAERAAAISLRQQQERQAYIASLRATERDNYYAALNKTRAQNINPFGGILPTIEFPRLW